MKKAWLLRANAQSDLSLRWAHMPLCWFCHEAAHICNLPKIASVKKSWYVVIIEGSLGKSCSFGLPRVPFINVPVEILRPSQQLRSCRDGQLPINTVPGQA